MKENKYYLVINDGEQGLLIRGLDVLKEEIKDHEETEGCVKVINELILKISSVSTKKFKVVNRDY